MSRDWPAVVVLCVVTMIGVAACTSSPPHEAAGAAQSASAEAGTRSGTASPSPATSSATPSQPAQPSPAQVATTATTGTTKKPATSAPHTTTTPAAPAGVRVTSVDLFLLNAGLSGPCGPTLPVKMVATVHYNAGGVFPAKIQVHSSDGHDPAPVSFTSRGSAMSVNLSATITVDPAHLQRTVDFWVETLEPTRMTSARSTYSMKCVPPANATS